MAEHPEQIGKLLAKRIVDVVGVKRDHPAPYRHWQIGQGADDRADIGKAEPQAVDLDAGEDRYHHGLIGQQWRELDRDLVQLLRLEAEHDELGLAARLAKRT